MRRLVLHAAELCGVRMAKAPDNFFEKTVLTHVCNNHAAFAYAKAILEMVAACMDDEPALPARDSKGRFLPGGAT